MKPGLKNPLKRVLDLCLYLSLCLLLGTGAVLTWKLVPGSEGGRGLTIFGWDRHGVGDIHFWTGVVFALLIAVHLAMNWQWLKKIAASGRAWRLGVGLGLGLVIIGGIYSLPVNSNRNDAPGERMGHGAGPGFGPGRTAQ